jgi:hypothetical protein
MAISTITHGRIALRPGTKNLEHSPSSVASISVCTASQGRMRRQSTKRRGGRDELAGSPVYRSGTHPGVKRERSGLGAGPPFGPLVMSLPHTAPWDLTNATVGVKYTFVEIV